jgi:two-component system LytT family sensor kinase
MRGWIPWLSQASASARSAGLLLQSQLQIQQFHDHSIRAEELLTLTARAELDAMRAQIRPHFLFNTLNSIHSFVRDDPEKAEQVIEQLSALMRSVLSSPDEDLITLQYEMDTVRNYLSIEYARYGERLKYEIQVPEALSGWKIPPFSVQPLVENVIKHAVDAQFEPVNLVIKAVDSSSKLIIEVVDDGPGLLDVKEGLGLATKNIKERLDRLYGSEANLGLQTNHSGGVTATLCVPADSNY